MYHRQVCEAMSLVIPVRKSKKMKKAKKTQNAKKKPGQRERMRPREEGLIRRPRGRKPNWAKDWNELQGGWVDKDGRVTRPCGSAPAKASKKRKANEAKSPDPDRPLLDVKEYVCPITGNLPVDPVMAEDGRIYERDAIEQWFQTNDGTQCPSPMTNKMIGRHLVEAIQQRNIIENLVENKLIVGEQADTWARETAEWNSMSTEMREHFRKASHGDANSTSTIAFAYRYGTHGRQVDMEQAARWFNKSTLLGSAMGGAGLAILYLNGTGVRACPVRGHIELARAAMAGSEHAAICLGQHMAEGYFVGDGDTDQARYWYKLSVDCTHKDATNGQKKMREEWLATHGRNYHIDPP